MAQRMLDNVKTGSELNSMPCPISVAQHMIGKVKTIVEINSMPWSPDFGKQLFTVVAIVDGVEPAGGWCYATCSQCSKALDVYQGLFWCSICHGVVRYPMIRFKVKLRVIDESRHGVFAMFNQQMEHLIDSSANKLLNGVGIGSKAIPDEFARLIGRIFNFTIKMPDLLNPDLDFHQQRVMRVSEVDPASLLVALPHQPRKCRNKKSIAAFPVEAKELGPSRNNNKCYGTAESSSEGHG